MNAFLSLSLWELQVIRDWLCVRDIAETSLNKLLLFLILKSSQRRCSVEKSVLKNFSGKCLCVSVFLKNVDSGKIFKNTYNYEQLSLHVALFTVSGKETANSSIVKWGYQGNFKPVSRAQKAPKSKRSDFYPLKSLCARKIVALAV